MKKIIMIGLAVTLMPVRDCKGCRFKFLPERKEEAEIEH
jgi:hypothetical protein